MCRYCETKTQLDIYSEEGLRAEIENGKRGPRLYMWTTVDAGYFGYIDIEGVLDIEYCPMCGRKLVEEESE